jgi:hypothetical protein
MYGEESVVIPTKISTAINMDSFLNNPNSKFHSSYIYIYIYSLDKVGKTITLSCKSLFCCGSGMIDPSILFHLLSNSVSNLLLDLYDSYACEFY